MTPRKAVVQQVAYYGASLALAALVPTLVRALSQLLSRTTRDPRRDGRGSKGTGNDAIVTDVNRGDAKSVFVAAVVGAAIGAGAALLLAPASGHQSREWLARRTRDLEDRVGVAFDRSKEVVKNGAIPS